MRSVLFLYREVITISAAATKVLIQLAIQVIEAVAKDLIEREKQKNTVKSREGTEYEVIKSEEANCLLCKYTDGIPTYGRAYITLQNAKDMDFSDD